MVVVSEAETSGALLNRKHRNLLCILFFYLCRVEQYKSSVMLETANMGAIHVTFKAQSARVSSFFLWFIILCLVLIRHVVAQISLITEATLREFFEVFGFIQQIVIRKHEVSDEGKQHGFAFLTYKLHEVNEQVIEIVRKRIVGEILYDCAWSKQYLDNYRSNLQGSSPHSSNSQRSSTNALSLDDITSRYANSISSNGNSSANHHENTQLGRNPSTRRWPNVTEVANGIAFAKMAIAEPSSYNGEGTPALPIDQRRLSQSHVGHAGNERLYPDSQAVDMQVYNSRGRYPSSVQNNGHRYGDVEFPRALPHQNSNNYSTGPNIGRSDGPIATTGVYGYGNVRGEGVNQQAFRGSPHYSNHQNISGQNRQAFQSQDGAYPPNSNREFSNNVYAYNGNLPSKVPPNPPDNRTRLGTTDPYGFGSLPPAISTSREQIMAPPSAHKSFVYTTKSYTPLPSTLTSSNAFEGNSMSSNHHLHGAASSTPRDMIRPSQLVNIAQTPLYSRSSRSPSSFDSNDDRSRIVPSSPYMTPRNFSSAPAVELPSVSSRLGENVVSFPPSLVNSSRASSYHGSHDELEFDLRVSTSSYNASSGQVNLYGHRGDVSESALHSPVQHNLIDGSLERKDVTNPNKMPFWYPASGGQQLMTSNQGDSRDFKTNTSSLFSISEVSTSPRLDTSSALLNSAFTSSFCPDGPVKNDPVALSGENSTVTNDLLAATPTLISSQIGGEDCN